MTATTLEPVRLGSFESGTEAFNQMRATRLGGSEIAAVVGLHPYESHLSLWFRKKGFTPPQPDNQLMEWGRLLEPLVFRKFAERHDTSHELHYSDWNYNPGSYTHPDRDWQLASPDGISASGTAIVEVKTVQNELDWGEENTNQIPINYRCQVLWNMDVMAADHCWLPVLIRGAFYREYLVEMDDEAQADLALLREAGQKFIQSLHEDKQPPIDGHDATYKAIRERHPAIDPGDVEIPGDLATAYLQSVLLERAAKENKQHHAAEIMQLMGGIRNAIHQHTQERFAYLKPASNPDRTPYLMAHPAAIKALQAPKTIQGDRHEKDQ
jgi:putative phage-type endonuclease